MASVTTMIVESDIAQPSGRRIVQYKFDLLDNLNQNHIVRLPPKEVPADWDTDADMLAIAPTLLVDKEQQEQQALQEQARNGVYVLHEDLGGYYGKLTLPWGTWDDQATAWLKFWLSQEDQLELANMQLDTGQISNTNMRNLLDITNQDVTSIRSDIQVAVDTKATLDAYSPYFDDDEGWIG